MIYPTETVGCTRRSLLGRAAGVAGALSVAVVSGAEAVPDAGHVAKRKRDRRLVIWRGIDAWRTEVASVLVTDRGVRASATQVGVDPLPYRLDYRLDAADGWITRRLVVEVEGSGWHRRLDLRHDGSGRWRCETRASGSVDLPDPGGDMASLAGALDCDLGLSPLTNLMPIRRSRLNQRAGAEDFLMAWVSVPDLAVMASAQRYEHVRRSARGSVVRYVDRGLFAGFTAELKLDRDGLVVVYPDLARQVKPRDRAR